MIELPAIPSIGSGDWLGVITIEVPHCDKWEETFDGKCDICRAPKTINEVTPGVQFGWRVGYVCASCSSRKTPNESSSATSGGRSATNATKP